MRNIVSPTGVNAIVESTDGTKYSIPDARIVLIPNGNTGGAMNLLLLGSKSWGNRSDALGSDGMRAADNLLVITPPTHEMCYTDGQKGAASVIIGHELVHHRFGTLPSAEQDGIVTDIMSTNKADVISFATELKRIFPSYIGAMQTEKGAIDELVAHMSRRTMPESYQKEFIELVLRKQSERLQRKDVSLPAFYAIADKIYDDLEKRHSAVVRFIKNPPIVHGADLVRATLTNVPRM
jgi:hypothetical protein